MVIIRKGNHALSVTLGAFLALYEPMGYTLATDAEEVHTDLPAPGGVITTHTPANAIEDESEGSEEYPDDYDAEEDEDLEEKPLSEMNFKELKECAARLGINTNGMSSKKDIRMAIVEARNTY